MQAEMFSVGRAEVVDGGFAPYIGHRHHHHAQLSWSGLGSRAVLHEGLAAVTQSCTWFRRSSHNKHTLHILSLDVACDSVSWVPGKLAKQQDHP